jgi:hypothetical protein
MDDCPGLWLITTGPKNVDGVSVGCHELVPD